VEFEDGRGYGRGLKKPSETDWARIDLMTDEEIDTSDIPPLDDTFFATARWRMPENELEALLDDAVRTTNKGGCTT
jgi:hypothetical protein